MRSARLAWKHLLQILSSLALTLAASAAYAYPLWQPDTFYAAGTFVTYNSADYVALVNQTDYAATGWNPTTASLWQPVGTSTPPPSNPPPSNPPPTNPPPGGGGNCAPAWSATAVYTGGMTASLSS